MAGQPERASTAADDTHTAEPSRGKSVSLQLQGVDRAQPREDANARKRKVTRRQCVPSPVPQVPPLTRESGASNYTRTGRRPHYSHSRESKRKRSTRLPAYNE